MTEAFYIIDGERFVATEHTRGLWSPAHRPLEGEWVGMRATTTAQPHGVGLADTQLFDTHGPVGRVVQSLVIEERSTSGR